MDTLIEFDYDINKCWSFKGDPCKDFFLFSIFTMWIFQDFYVTQILREINFGHFEAPKTAL